MLSECPMPGRRSVTEESRIARSGAPARLWSQSARRVRVEFTLQLRRQRNGREVLEFYVIDDSEPAANGSFAISSRVKRKPYAWTKIVLVRLRIAERDDAWSVGDRVQGLSTRSQRIGPVFVPQPQVHSEPRRNFVVVLDEPAEQALGAKEAPRSGVAQGSSRIVRQQVVDEGVCRLVLVIAVAPRQEELRIDEMGVAATELKGVLAVRPGECISDLVGVLFLEGVVARPHGDSAQQIVDGDVLRARCARIDGSQREERILQAQVVHQSTGNGPNVVQGNLAVVDGLSLVEDGLSGIHRQDEVLLVEQEPRAKLVAAHRIVGVRLYVMLALENRTENGDVADGNGRRGPRHPRMNRHSSFIVRHSHRKILQQIRDRTIRGVGLQYCPSRSRGRGESRGRALAM